MAGAVALSALLLAALGATTSGAAGTAAAGGPSARRSTVPASHYRHVFVVVMENQPFGEALSVPGYASLAHRYAYASRSYAASHPSLPNYLALTSGSTFGITSDCLSCFIRSDNLGAELSAHHIGWEAFFQDVSSPCYLGTSYGSYAAKHNPFRYYVDVRSSRSLCSHLRPFGELASFLDRPAPSVPAFVWVTPNICDDGHSCAQDLAAGWLRGFVAKVTASSAWRDDGILFITWDEGSDADTSSISPSGRVRPTGGGGHILTIVVAPALKRGTVLSTPMTPYSILAAIEENFGLPLLHGAVSWRHRPAVAVSRS